VNNLEDGAVCSSEMLVSTLTSTQRHYSEDEQHFHPSDNLISQALLIYLSKQIYLISIDQTIYPSVCLSVCVSVCRSISLSVFLSIYSSIYLSVWYPYTDPSFNLKLILNPIHIFVLCFSKIHNSILNTIINKFHSSHIRLCHTAKTKLLPRIDPSITPLY
jgi:hypothetical protein